MAVTGTDLGDRRTFHCHLLLPALSPQREATGSAFPSSTAPRLAQPRDSRPKFSLSLGNTLPIFIHSLTHSFIYSSTEIFTSLPTLEREHELMKHRDFMTHLCHFQATQAKSPVLCEPQCYHVQSGDNTTVYTLHLV